MTYALAPSIIGADVGRSDREGDVFPVGLLRASVDAAQPVRETPKTFAVAHHKWRKLRFGTISGALEQFS